jgi:hypothetical protein
LRNDSLGLSSNQWPTQSTITKPLSVYRTVKAGKKQVSTFEQLMKTTTSEFWKGKVANVVMPYDVMVLPTPTRSDSRTTESDSAQRTKIKKIRQ